MRPNLPESTPPAPRCDGNGIPWHRDECPWFDGKRCGLIGFRPDAICEESVRRMAEKLRGLLAPPAPRADSEAKGDPCNGCHGSVNDGDCQDCEHGDAVRIAEAEARIRGEPASKGEGCEECGGSGEYQDTDFCEGVIGGVTRECRRCNGTGKSGAKGEPG